MPEELNDSLVSFLTTGVLMLSACTWFYIIASAAKRRPILPLGRLRITNHNPPRAKLSRLLQQNLRVISGCQSRNF